jgi:hypothetical protein
MRLILPLTLLVLLFMSYASYAGDPNCIPCIQGGGSTDYLNVTLLSAHTIDSLSGEITLMFEEYTTAEDPTCGDIEVFVDRKNCPYFLVPDSLISEDFCIELCGDSTNCKRWGHCDGCPFWAHSYST